MPLRIRISNLNKSRRINHRLIEKAARKVLKKYKRSDGLIDITFVSDKKIKALNEKYMKRSYTTDVLSFPLEEHTRTRKSLVGDIYISSDTANSNAKRFNTRFAEEIILYTIHGVLHLLGFGDGTARERKKIRKLEKELLKNTIK